ncbi:MAG: glutamine--fructose-6-phosphate transaminase (isomerizing) [Firmicutes bacterium]|nr:glutamine--fructose-6-phosphate transaminase (isomerizing) [Bacillota bacterium]
MCGIVGYVGSRPLVPLLLEGLKRLEYRGYDSAGIAVGGNGNGLCLRRASGKLANLERALCASPLHGTYGLGHTRWATHGPPSERNAHPHTDCSGRLALVHNGIIENYAELKQRLLAAGHSLRGETDSEVVAHLIEEHLGGDLAAAVRAVVGQLRGSFALAVISRDDPETIVAARWGAPVVLGLGEQEYFVASDVLPILPYTRQVIYLADGEVAVLRRTGICVTGFDGTPRRPKPQTVTWDAAHAEKNGFRHFMLKEIYEQPIAIRETLRSRVDWQKQRVALAELDGLRDRVDRWQRIHLVACGTSLHAAMAGKWMVETLARIPVEVDYGSEYRYRNPVLDAQTLTVLVSQSGETADTLAAAHQARRQGATTLAITNVPGSTLARESDATLLTRAGPEIGVAATKTFSAQLTALLLLALDLAQRRSRLSEARAQTLFASLAALPARIEQVLERDPDVEALARRFYRARDCLYLGRGIHFPIALEGALKLKEISYIHAEGYPAGEMKHGPNALIDDQLPVVFLATCEPGQVASELLYQKTLSNMEEVRARQGRVIAVVNEGDREARKCAEAVLEIPSASEFVLPLLEVIPLQLFAYHIAVLRGCDVDQPRNLAKSVTVE